MENSTDPSWHEIGRTVVLALLVAIVAIGMIQLRSRT